MLYFKVQISSISLFIRFYFQRGMCIYTAQHLKTTKENKKTNKIRLKYFDIFNIALQYDFNVYIFSVRIHGKNWGNRLSLAKKQPIEISQGNWFMYFNH